jgi:hypothetical protein
MIVVNDLIGSNMMVQHATFLMAYPGHWEQTNNHKSSFPSLNLFQQQVFLNLAWPHDLGLSSFGIQDGEGVIPRKPSTTAGLVRTKTPLPT